MSEIASIRSVSVADDTANLRPTGGFIKRLFDIVLATVGIVILLPLFSLCILATLLTSRGSIIFRHRRVGFQGRHFDCMKFNTMAPNANKLLHPFGAMMRKTGLDELPELFNVLKGDMSIVGPRPITDDEVEKYADRISAYLACKPGITGLWQVSSRSKISYNERVMFEHAYTENWSLIMDAKILLGTLPAVIDSDDAC
jgi:exopolysaccharide production protein ExoY